MSAASVSAQSISLPGTIQVEDFDQGAAEGAYHDQSSGNSGGEYRATDVDIEACDEGGFNVGWIYPGEWLQYTVSLSQSGAYTLEFRVASPGTGGTFHIEVNGVDRTGPITAPDTGGWQNWTTVTKSGVNLNAGSQTWRLVFDAAGSSGSLANFNYIRATAQSSGSASSTPYRSTPLPLPGTVQLEDFDNGGEGNAYHDLNAANDGEEYRSTGVDIESSTDAGGGYNVGYAFAGEWLNYTVNVAAAGTYDVEVRVASPGAGGTFHLEVNGVNKGGAFNVPNTGGWQTWVTLRKSGITLSAGQQVIKLVMDSESSSGAVANFNYLRVSSGTGSGGGGSTPYTGTAVALPGTVQFEAFDNGDEGVAYHDLSAENSGGAFRTTGVDVEPTTDAGGGYNVGWTYDGEWLAYTVNVTTAGTYDIEARVASSGSGGTFHIEINGVDRTGPFTVPNTGGWQSWTTIRKTGLNLSAGQQVWRLVMDADVATQIVGNLNYFRVVSASGTSNQPPNVSITSPANGASYTAPASVTINATASDSDGSVAQVDFYAGSQFISSDTSSPYSASWSGAGPGNYALTAVARDNQGATRTSTAVNVAVTGSGGGGGGGATWTSGDVGSPDSPGSSSTSGGTFTVHGTGEDIWDTADQFRFVYQQLQGDVEVIARVDSLQGPDIWSKGGVMIRGSLSAGSPNMLVAATIGSGWTFQRRRADGAISVGPGATKAGTAPGWVRITRQGSQLSGFTSTDGNNWTLFNSDTIALPSTVYVGLAVTAHSPTGQATAIFSNVTARPLSQTNNPPPTVSLTGPANGATYSAPANMTITATASDSNGGSVSRVDFYAGGTLLGSDASSPYSFNWTAVAAGSYALTAVAVDNDGASTTSGAVNVSVSGVVTTPTTVVFNPSPDHATLVSSVLRCALPQWRPGHGDAGRDEEPWQADTVGQRDLGVDLGYRQSSAVRFVLRGGHGQRLWRHGAKLAVVTVHEMS